MDAVLEHQNQRIYRLKTIVQSIRDAEKEFSIVEEEKLISEIQYRFGCSRRTVLEYLATLEGTGKIVREGEKVWTQEGYKGHLEYLESKKSETKQVQEAKQ